MRIKTHYLWFCLLSSCIPTWSKDCFLPDEGDIIKVSNTRFDDFLLQEDPEVIIENRLESMDTSNCFVFKLKGGASLVGELTRASGSGLTRFGIRAGNTLDPIPLERVEEIIEFKINFLKIKRRRDKKVDSRGSAIKSTVVVSAVGFAFLFLLSVGVFAGGE